MLILQPQYTYLIKWYLTQGTFDVQNVDTTIHDQHTDITCYFSQESDIKGCKIALQIPENNNNTFCQFVASKTDGNKATVTVALPDGTYTLLAYDDEDGAVHNPAFTTTLSVHGSPQVSGRVRQTILIPAHTMYHSTECAIVENDDIAHSPSINYVTCKFMQNIPLITRTKHCTVIQCRDCDSIIYYYYHHCHCNCHSVHLCPQAQR